MTQYTTFTSESVSEGHPDKMADQISDAILDAILTEDPHARIAVETLVKTGMAIIAGEVRTHTYVSLEDIVRDVILAIGYNSSDVGFDGASCAVLNAIGKQSADIAMGVDEAANKDLGAGDQGLMFGYATSETDTLMPAPIYYAHRLVERQAYLRKHKVLPLAPPRCQKPGDPALRRQNSPSPLTPSSSPPSTILTSPRPTSAKPSWKKLSNPCCPTTGSTPTPSTTSTPPASLSSAAPSATAASPDAKSSSIPTAAWLATAVVPSPAKTPPKSIAPPPTPVATSPKNIVAAGLAQRCEIQVSYAIGVAEPTSIAVNTFGTGQLPDDRIATLIREHFDLRPQGLIDMLDLRRPIYRQTAAYGHFGRELPELTWEKTNKAEALKEG